MLWIIAMGILWAVALIILLGFIWHAKRVNERYDRDAAVYFEQLCAHAESRGLENLFSDTKPAFLETEMLTSRRKVAKAFGGDRHERI